jgi:hypothetical protein
MQYMAMKFPELLYLIYLKEAMQLDRCKDMPMQVSSCTS